MAFWLIYALSRLFFALIFAKLKLISKSFQKAAILWLTAAKNIT